MTDPWLPHRLDAVLRAQTVETSLRRSIWAALSAWLAGTARRVLRGGAPPDLDVIWARAPAWRAAVHDVVQGDVRRAMGRAYAPLLGRGYGWEQRPAVATYLAEAENRLVNVPDQVYDLAAGQLVEGIGLGEGVPQLSDRVDNVLSTTGSDRWPNRATVIARTETIGALNAGRADAFNAFEQEEGLDLEKVWLSTSDSRTRATHREADGQRVPNGARFNVGGFELAFPGDPTGPPQEVIQCRCTMLLMEPGEEIDLSNRQLK